MSKTTITLIISAVVALIAGVLLFSNDNSVLQPAPSSLYTRSTPSPSPTPEISTSTSPESTPNPTPNPTPPSASIPTPAVSPSLKVFIITGQSFSFAPSTMTVKKGDRVKIIFKNAGGFHDLLIDELGVQTDRINTGGEHSVEFIANKTGSFAYYCSVGNHRSLGMQGTIVVE